MVDLLCTLCSATLGYQIESKGEHRQDCDMSVYNKAIVKISKKDAGMVVKTAKNQQKNEAEGKGKLKEAKKQKNPEQIIEMTGKGGEDAGKMIKTLYVLTVVKNLYNIVMLTKVLHGHTVYLDAVYNKTIVKISKKDAGKMVKNAKNQQKQEAEQDKRKLEEAVYMDAVYNKSLVLQSPRVY